ncbi:hypothetical protein LBMAG41_10440 [Cyanobium sp.]|nr:hypothetical protein LBMAG41_10440 [Cyanobium sp.]
MTADELYEAISSAISKSLCSVFEVVGILETAKQDVLMAALKDGDEEGEEGYEVVGE